MWPAVDNRLSHLAVSFPACAKVKPIPFQDQSPGSSFWTPGMTSWSLFLSRNTLQEAHPGFQEYPCEAYSFPGPVSRKPISFQEHSPGSSPWIPGIPSWSLFLSRNTLQEALFEEHSPGSSSWIPGIPFWSLFLSRTLSRSVLPSRYGAIFKNIYQMVKNRAANMKAKTYFWPGRQNLCYYSANFSNLWFFMLRRLLLFIKAYFYPAVKIYAFIFLRELLNLWFFMLRRPLLFIKTYFIRS